MTQSPKVEAFLEALKYADGEAFCVPPGLGGGWRVKHVRTGLERHVLCVHSSGQLLAYTAYSSKHGACQNCAGRKGAICAHCNCAHCQFDRLTSEHGGNLATREQAARLRAQIQQFQFGRRGAVEALDEI
jgi:hypothetical protein